MTNKRVKILFHLEHDADNYPPADYEHLWAITKGDDEYEIDNIPFFVKGISSGDLVHADLHGDDLTFDRLIRRSEHSTVRVIMFDLGRKHIVREHLAGLGCETEGSHLKELFSVDVPPAVNYSTVIKYLRDMFDADVLDYEEAALRH